MNLKGFAFSVIWLAALAASGCGHDRHPASARMFYSPGQYEIAPGLDLNITRDGVLVTLAVEESGRGVARESLGSDAMRWFVYADPANELWAYSGDIGVAHLRRDDQGRWTTTWLKRGDAVPKIFFDEVGDPDLHILNAK